MENQKTGALLNLALDATDRERKESMELDVGYDPEDDRWDLIIRYSGDIRKLESSRIRIVPLLGNYAVVNIPQDDIESFSKEKQVEYIEKPKSLYFSTRTGRAVSCINSIQNQGLRLKGKGVLIGCVDSGIDYTHPDFLDQEGKTRILYLWDQTIQGKPPEGYDAGTEFSREEINRALDQENKPLKNRQVPGRDISGHGTAVMGIAAGNGAGSGGEYKGVAPESSLLVVKLKRSSENSFPRTTELIQGVDYLVKKAMKLGMPLALNLSFGNNYGPHDGTSLCADYINSASNAGRTCICVGTGNEGNTGRHYGGKAEEGKETEVEFSVGPFTSSLNLQIWKNYQDKMKIYVLHPFGTRLGPIENVSGTSRIREKNTQLLIYYGQPSPYSMAQEIYIDFLPEKDYVDSGIWKIFLVPEKIVEGDFDMYLPGGKVLDESTRFYKADPGKTLTVPSTAVRVISVGAYDSQLQSYAEFSGRGYGPECGRVKPELAAPGVDLVTTRSGGGYTQVTGTSFAVPFVTGAAALLMEWGIVRENDPYLYGEKVKSYLISGARRLPGQETYPNDKAGYGALCVADSIPRKI